LTFPARRDSSGFGSWLGSCWHRSASGRLRRTVARKSGSRLWRRDFILILRRLASGIGNWDQPRHTTCRGRPIWENPTYSAFWSGFGVTCPRMQRLASSVGSGRTARLAPRKNLPDSGVRSYPGGCYVRREGPRPRTSARSGRWCGRQSPPNRPFPRLNNVNGMRNPAPINHFPPTLFSPNRSFIYEEAHFFPQRARSPKSKV